MPSLQILIIGDHDAEHAPHRETREAVIAAAADLHLRANTRWVGADDLVLYPDLVMEAAGVLLPPPGPRCPQLLPEPELDALKQAREGGVPTLAMGASHSLMLIEFARHVLGLAGANSTWYDEETPHAVVSNRLGLKGPIDPGSSLSALSVTVDASSTAAGGHTIGSEWTDAQHGLAADYAAAFEHAGFHTLGRDSDGQPVLHRLENHPFWVAAAFLPFHGRLNAGPHPLVVNWLKAAATQR